MKRPLHLEPLAYCMIWIALALFGWDRFGIRTGLLLSAGLFAIIMPTSALILSRTGNFVLERSVRWGILVVTGIALLSVIVSS